jgi:cytosine/adenosine deaminase-related metal-dependent hydrolase
MHTATAVSDSTLDRGYGPGLTLRGGTAVNPTNLIRGDVHIAGQRFALHAPAGSFVLDLEGCWIYPGLINAHDHLHLNSLPPLTDLGIFPNAYRWIDAAQARRAQPAMADAESTPMTTRLWHGALKNLLSGATTVVHHDPWEAEFQSANFPVRVPPGYGWCHSLGLSGATRASALRYGPSLEESLEGAPVRHDAKEDTPEAASWRWYIHLAEGTDAIAVHELDQLDRLGALDRHTVLVHATGLRAHGVGRVREVGAWVVWCPASNRALLGTTLDPRPFAAEGRIALGTDSRLSGSADLLDELREAARSGWLSSAALMATITRDAARVIGRADLGAVLPGCRADFVAIECRIGEWNPYDALLTASRRDLALVVRDGVPLLANERFASWMASGYSSRDALAEIIVDGMVKWCPRRVLGPAGAIDLEPGVRVVAS